MSTDTEKPLNGTPEPFRRPVVWGRPPQTVFRAGPLPKGGSLPPLPEPPRRPAGSGILSGSMIPRAASAPALPTPRELSVPAATPETPPKDHAADLTVRPLPPHRPEPVKPATALQLDTLPAFQPTVGSEVERPANPGPAAGTRKPANRTPLYAGIAIAAVVLLAVGGWIWTRPPTEVSAPVPVAVPPAPATAPEIPPAPAAAVVALPDKAAPVAATVPPRPTAAAPARTRAPEPVARPAASPPPERLAPPVPVANAPLIEIVPGPPPTPAPIEAERAPTDPDAPIATRPQPIG